MSSGGNEIRIIRKKKGGHGHHGGAWKVAYADFVTAMMAFFLVMWILGLSQEVRRAIAGYFRDPVGFMEAQSQGKAPFNINMETAPGKLPNPNDFNGQAMSRLDQLQKGQRDGKSSKEQKEAFEQVKQQLEKALTTLPELSKLRDHVNILIVEEGLRIELIEGPEPLFFLTGSAQVTPAAQELIALIGREVSKLPNRVAIEGHTDSRPYPASATYTNWELSADRANAARRILEGSGLWKQQVMEVRGYADTRLRVPSDPYHYSNRRVSLLIPYHGVVSQESHQPSAVSKESKESKESEPRNGSHNSH